MSYWEINTTNKRFRSCNYNLIPSVPIFTFIQMFSMSRIEVSETLVFYGSLTKLCGSSAFRKFTEPLKTETRNY